MASEKTSMPAKMTPAQLKTKIQNLEEQLEKLTNSAWCYLCDKHKTKDNFYVSTDPLNKSGITPICKMCAKKIAVSTDKSGNEICTKESIQLALRYLNKPFISTLWDSSIKEAESLSLGKVYSTPFSTYMKNIAMGQYNGKTYSDSDIFNNTTTLISDGNTDNSLLITETDDFVKMKKDVIRLLGYDPFIAENPIDQLLMYPQLLGMIDSGGDENDDMIRNASCISIVRGFVQADKIDNAISKLMTDVYNIEKNSTTIKTLQESKSKIMGVIKDLAAESCISLKNNKNVRKGSNTWTGKVKMIKDLDLREGRVNGFDIETSKAMRQVMDMSHKSILQELKLDESDWSDMVAQQRDMIVNLQRDLDNHIEMCRILLAENLDLKDFLQENNINIEGYSFANLDDMFSQYSAGYDEENNLENISDEEESDGEK